MFVIRKLLFLTLKWFFSLENNFLRHLPLKGKTVLLHSNLVEMLKWNTCNYIYSGKNIGHFKFRASEHLDTMIFRYLS